MNVKLYRRLVSMILVIVVVMCGLSFAESADILAPVSQMEDQVAEGENEADQPQEETATEGDTTAEDDAAEVETTGEEEAASDQESENGESDSKEEPVAEGEEQAVSDGDRETSAEGEPEGEPAVEGEIPAAEEGETAVKPAHYSIAKENSNVYLTLDEGAKALETPFVYVVWGYTLADGTNFSFIKTIEVSRSTGAYRLGNPVTPDGASLDYVCVIVCDDLDLEEKGVAEANAKNYGYALF